MSVALSDVSSATATAELTIDQSSNARSTSQTSGTALKDMLTIVDTAATTLGSIPVSTAKQRSLRDEAIAEVQNAKNAILDAQYALERKPEAIRLAQTLREVQAVSKKLESLTRELPRPR